MKTVKIRLDTIKEPDEWGRLIAELGLTDEVRSRHFEWSEYASLELEIDEELRIIGGRIVPLPGVR